MSPILWDCVGGFGEDKLSVLENKIIKMTLQLPEKEGLQVWATILYCFIQLGVVQNPLAGKTLLKQALYLQQSLVYPELRHMN